MRANCQSSAGRTLSGLGGILLLSLLPGLATGAGAAPPEVLPGRVPAAGEQAVTVRVAALGRYALAVESLQGVALTHVDRLAGEVATAGEAGEADGRLDLFLEPGEIRVRTRGPELGRGEARLTLTPFRELHGNALPHLTATAQLSTELGDHEQRSWWVEAVAGEPLLAEAAGRHLADLRLWQGGDWLLPALPVCEPIEPVAGRPLTRCRLQAELPPGRYRLSAYGGPGLAWARAGGERPLHLRLGTSRRAEAGRERLTIGPFGSERFVLPGSTTFARIELPAPGRATLRFGDYEPDAPFAAPWRTAEIDEETLAPVVELRRRETDGEALLEIEGIPGQELVCEHLRVARKAPVTGAGPHWVGSVHAGTAADAIDATGLLVLEVPDGAPRLLAARTVELGGDGVWHRRFQLDDTATLFLHVAEPGGWELTTAGVAVEARIEPFLLSPPANYRPPALRETPLSWELDRGYWVLTLRPVRRGIVTAALHPAGTPVPAAFTAPLPAVRLGAVDLDPESAYTLWLNEQPDVAVGPVARPLPLDLAAPLPLALRPGEEIELPVLVPAPGHLRAVVEDGSAWELSLDGAPWTLEPGVSPGTGALRVRSTSAASLSASLALVPDAVAGAPATALAAPPPLLAESLSLTLARHEGRSFRLPVTRAGLYTFKSTGLLATAGSLRGRVLAPFAFGMENGTGRNFRLAAWLPEGEYQLQVESLGESAGPAGLRWRRGELRDGGELLPAVSARAELGAGEGIVWRFDVPEPGRYEVEARRAGRPAPFRLEDPEGFPVGEALAEGMAEVRLTPGSHRLLVLGDDAAGPLVVRLERHDEPAAATGHGPHPLPLGVTREHLWREPEGEASEASERPPDRWRFTLPAPAEVILTLDPEMTGTLLRPGAAADEPLPAARPLSLRLAAGEHELRLRAGTPDDLRPYELRIDPVPLLAGLERELTAPGEVEVAVGAAGSYLLESRGEADLRARLLDAGGRVVAAGDDRPGDWNFQLALPLVAGRYRLQVDPVGGEPARSRVAMRALPEREEGSWNAAGERRVTLGEEALVLPLALPARAELLAVAARSESAVGLRLDRRDGDGWREVAAADGPGALLAVPLGEKAPLRLRLLGLDLRPAVVTLHGFAGPLRELRERDLAREVALPALAGFSPPLAAATLRLERPGALRLSGQPAALLASGEPLASLTFAGDLLVATGNRLWVAAAGGGAPRLTATRATAGSEGLTLSLTPDGRAACDLANPEALRWVEATAPAGTLLVNTALADGSRRWDRASAPGRAGAATVAQPGDRTAFVRSEGSLSPSVQLKSTPLALAPAVELAAGESRLLELPAGGGRELRLPAGRWRLALALERGAALALGDAATPEALVRAEEEHHAESLLTSARRALALNPTGAARQLRIALEPLLPGEETAARLGPDGRLELLAPGAGTLRLDLPPASGPVTRLRVAGATALLVAADGSLQHGPELRWPAVGGTLRLRHDAGPVALWPAAGDPAALGFSPAPAATPLASRTRLAGGAEQRLTLPTGAPALLALHGPAPLFAALVTADGMVGWAGLLAPGTAAVLPVPDGGGELRLRGLAGAPLPAGVEIALAPVTPLGDGLGEERLLAPGEAHGYTFTLETARRVGLGVRSDSGRVEGTLFAADGRTLAAGGLLWEELPAGRYLFALQLSPAAPAALAAPVAVGLTPAGLAPPPAAELARLRELAAAPDPPPPGAIAGEIAWPLTGIPSESDEPTSEESDR
ncbi:MAG TPA: hypothetical protein PLQ31_01680 [Thermoanaerobaculia bacterium]|nr:hypothetical protein [Thermoanaerobaculia bacterium]